MTTRIKDYGVGELARISGVSVRALHHYDEIGLLSPAYTAPNGYRRYGREELLRLQEILFARELGLSLAEITSFLEDGSGRLARLLRHRDRLVAERQRVTGMIETLDRTVAHLKGERDMANEDLYRPFAPERQAEYEAWLIDTYGGDMAERIARSKQAMAEAPERMQGFMDALRRVEEALVARFEAGTAAEDASLHDALEDHRALMVRAWDRPCPPEGVRGLAETYLAHPDFVARYERLSPGYSQWLPAAMRAHADRLDRAG